MNTDDLAWLRTCGAAGIEKEGGTCGVEGGKASGSARRRIGVSMWGWEDGWKGVWIRQEGGSV